MKVKFIYIFIFSSLTSVSARWLHEVISYLYTQEKVENVYNKAKKLIRIEVNTSL